MGTFLCVLLVLQGQAEQPASIASPLSTAAVVRATLAAEAPVLDGRDDDAVWRLSPPIDRFLEAKPTEGAEPTFRTEARVAYDARNLYVFVRAFDSHPDSIVSLLSRRDDQTASDEIILMLDPYHDRRTGYEFVVNPAGVKSDYAIYNDGDEDVAWDAVWDAATRIDSLGWTAEYRIPLSQLHYSAKGKVTFGLSGVAHHPAPYRVGHVAALPDLQIRLHVAVRRADGTRRAGEPGPRRADAVRGHQERAGPRFPIDLARNQRLTVGGDLKYRVASNLLLNATVNPDFGQVEADPSELNLSALETFFTERRPFFVESKGLFTFTVNCVVVVDCNTGEGLFYSRRIGRSPQLSDTYAVRAVDSAGGVPGAHVARSSDAA